MGQRYSSEALEEALRETTRILDGENISYALAYGTLLGMVRSKRPIDGDDDVDLFVLSEHWGARRASWEGTSSRNRRPLRRGPALPSFTVRGVQVDLYRLIPPRTGWWTAGTGTPRARRRASFARLGDHPSPRTRARADRHARRELVGAAERQASPRRISEDGEPRLRPRLHGEAAPDGAIGRSPRRASVRPWRRSAVRRARVQRRRPEGALPAISYSVFLGNQKLRTLLQVVSH